MQVAAKIIGVIAFGPAIAIFLIHAMAGKPGPFLIKEII